MPILIHLDQRKRRPTDNHLTSAGRTRHVRDPRVLALALLATLAAAGCAEETAAPVRATDIGGPGCSAILLARNATDRYVLDVAFVSPRLEDRAWDNLSFTMRTGGSGVVRSTIVGNLTDAPGARVWFIDDDGDGLAVKGERIESTAPVSRFVLRDAQGRVVGGLPGACG